MRIAYVQAAMEAKAAEGAGGPDGPCPVRPQPSAAQADHAAHAATAALGPTPAVPPNHLSRNQCPRVCLRRLRVFDRPILPVPKPRRGIWPRATRGRAAPTEARPPHPCARQAGCVGEGTRPLRLRVLAPCRRTKAQKPAPRPAQINARISNCLARPCPPRLTPPLLMLLHCP